MLVLTRDSAIEQLHWVTVAPLTRTIRGLESEVVLESDTDLFLRKSAAGMNSSRSDGATESRSISPAVCLFCACFVFALWQLSCFFSIRRLVCAHRVLGKADPGSFSSHGRAEPWNTRCSIVVG